MPNLKVKTSEIIELIELIRSNDEKNFQIVFDRVAPKQTFKRVRNFFVKVKINDTYYGITKRRSDYKKYENFIEFATKLDNGD